MNSGGKLRSSSGSPRSLNQHMLHGSIWMILLRWAIRLTGLVSTVILARLLSPTDFGIVAMAMFVVGLLELLNQSGQKLAIIRHTAPGRGDYDTAWTLSVLAGILIAVAIVAAAPLARYYFHEPRVGPVMDCLAIRSILGGFENIGATDFRRDMQFNRFFLYNIYAKLVSFVMTVGLALIWRNYWALVAGIISSQLAMNILSYTMHPYRPRFSLAKLSEFWAFSTWTLVRTVGLYLNAQIDQIAVGGMFGATAMGRYAVASDVASSPSREINDPMVAVLYPVMAKVRSQPDVLRNLYLRTFGWSTVICVSASVGVAMVAHDLVRLVLGEKWMDIEPIMGWLALDAGVLGLCSGAYTTFDTIGKPFLGARMQWIRLLFLALVLIPIALILKSIPAIAIGRLVVTVLFIPTLLFTVGHEVEISPEKYFGVLWRPVAAAAAMAAILFFVNARLSAGNLRLSCDVVLGVFSFSATMLLAWRLSGCPSGPESDVLAALAGTFRKARNDISKSEAWSLRRPRKVKGR